MAKTWRISKIGMHPQRANHSRIGKPCRAIFIQTRIAGGRQSDGGVWREGEACAEELDGNQMCEVMDGTWIGKKAVGNCSTLNSVCRLWSFVNVPVPYPRACFCCDSWLDLLDAMVLGLRRPPVWPTCLADVLPLEDLAVDDVQGCILAEFFISKVFLRIQGAVHFPAGAVANGRQ